ncbi:MAG: cytochrome c biogenesis protein ResB [Burkholderiaceae bacterium]
MNRSESPTVRRPTPTPWNPAGAASLAVHALASLKLTLWVLLMLAAGVLLAYRSETHTTWALVLPLALFAVNLAAAVATNAVFRRQSALLMFHLALIAIVLLVAAGRLSYLKGHVELTDGAWFDGTLTQYESGPWHVQRLASVAFANLGFDIAYAPGLKRGKTVNAVAYRDAEGVEHRAQIGDNVPLVLAGYRFYTSFNKGFAPLFVWNPARGGAPQRGSVHLPAYPRNEYRQALEWTPPGSATPVWTMLQFDEVLLDAAEHSQFRLPSEHRVVMRIGEVRRELQPGQSIDLPGGVLVYEGLAAWMGYTVFHDWTIPWLLAACLTAVACLAWHFWSKYARLPWRAGDA